MKILILTGGNIDIEFLKIKLKDFDKIIAVDKGLELLYKIGNIPDIMVGDFDSVDKDILEFYKSKNIETHEFNSEKDYTDTELAINVAIECKPSKITIIGGTGTRLDHTLSNIHIMKKCLENSIYCEILDINNRIYLVDTLKEIKKQDAFGKFISIIPLTTSCNGITLKGFKYLLENYDLEIGKSLGISNEIVNDTAMISLKEGILIVIESKD